jgi:hypothetical protein
MHDLAAVEIVHDVRRLVAARVHKEVLGAIVASDDAATPCNCDWRSCFLFI